MVCAIDELPINRTGYGARNTEYRVVYLDR